MAKKKMSQQDIALEVVCNIGRAVATEADLPTLLELIYQESSRVIHADCFAMALYDPLEDALRLELLYDRGERLQPLLLRRAEGWGLAGRVFKKRSPLLFTDLAEGELPPEAAGLGGVPRSWLGVPLIAREQAIGVVSVQSYSPDAFGAADQRLLEAIASQAAVAIENLSLRREHERRIAELSALTEIGRSIITATQVEDILEAIYRETSRVMDTSNLYVALYHPETEMITFDYFVEDGQRVPSEPLPLSGGGLTVRVVTTREPLLLEDVPKQMPERGIEAIGRPAQSYLGVPMFVGDRVVGVVSVQSPIRLRAYDRRHQDLLSNIANLAAVAIENARLSRERERRLTELSVVNEIGRALASAPGLEAMIELIYQQVSRTFDTTNFYIALYDEKVDEQYLPLQIEYGERQEARRRKGDVGLTGYIIRTKKPLLLRSLEELAAFHEAQGIQTSGPRALSWMGVPLIAGDTVVGVMGIQSYEQENLYAEQDLALFSTIAAQAAIALDNVRLLREHERRIAELSALNEIGRAIITTTRTEEILEAIYREMSRVMDTSNLYVALYHPEQELVTFDYFIEDGERVEKPAVHLSEGGLTVQIVTSRQPLLLGENIEQELAALGIEAIGRPAQSYLGVPMLAGDRVVGVISVQSPGQARAYDGRHRNLVSNIANLAAVAIENARLSQERERRITELSTITEISRAVSSALELGGLLETVRQQVSRVFDTTNFYIGTYEEETSEWTLAFSMEHGERDPRTGTRFKVGMGLTGHIIRNREPLLLSSFDEINAFHESRGIPFVGEPARCWMGVPLIAADKLVGVMAVQSYEQEHLYSEADLGLFYTIGTQIAAAIRNARLFSELQTRLGQLNALQATGEALTGTLELDAVLDKVLQGVTTTIGFSLAIICLVDEELGEVYAVRGAGVSADLIALSRRRLDSPDITADIIRTGKTEVIEGWDDRFDREVYEKFGQADLVRVFAPLSARGKVIGLIEAGYPKAVRATISRDDLDVLQTFLAQASVAIDNARLFQELEQRLADLSVLNEVAQAILEADTEDSLLKAIHLQVGRVMDTTNFYVALYDEATQEIDFAYSIEDGVRTTGPERYSISRGGVTAYVIQKREPLFFEQDMDAQLAGRGIVGLGRPALSYMGVPMIAGEQILGAMGVQSYEREHAFNERHMALFTNISTQAALAIQRIRLRASEARKARHLAIIGDVSRKVTAILDLGELLRELARSIQLGFGYNNVAVFRVDEQAQELLLGALVGPYAGVMDWGYRQPLKEGLPGWAVQNRQTVLCNNTAEDPRFTRGFDAEETTLSELCVPISFASRVIGVLDIQAEEVGAFDQEDVAAMETLAGQLATAMRNAILFHERGTQLASLNALNRVIQATAAALSLDDLLTALCDVVVELMSPDVFFVALYEREGGDLVAPLLMDEGVFHRNVRFTQKGLTEYMLGTRQPLYVRNMGEEAARYPVEDTLMGSGKPAVSWLGVPLLAGEKPVGAIVVQSYRPYAFDERDAEFVQAAASQVVVSIEKARLFEETQRAVEDLRTASEQQRRLLDMVRELSTPLVPIAEDILVLPLVGTIDSQRAQQIMDVLLQGISSERARVVIMDITGVPIVDTSVANYLLQATQAVRLLGAECILVGITPEVAQTVVGLGMELRGLITRSDLQGGVEYALRLLGRRILKPAKRSALLEEGPPTPEVHTPEPAPPAPSP